MIFLQSRSYNLRTAKIFGVRAATFIGFLLEQFDLQLRNKTINNNDTISISRSEIYENTALDDSEQSAIEANLVECGVIVTKPLQNVPNKNYYIINN